MNKFSRLLIAFCCFWGMSGASQAAISESLTTVRTQVYDEKTNQYSYLGPLSFQYSLDPNQPCTPALCGYGVVVNTPISFQLAGFTFTDARFYPNSGGFDGLDVDGVGSNGDLLAFGYAFLTSSLLNDGVYHAYSDSKHFDNSTTLTVGDPGPQSAAPEPQSGVLIAAGLAGALAWRGRRHLRRQKIDLYCCSNTQRS